MHCKGGRKKWISIWSVVSKSEDGLVLYQSNYNSRWCSSYHFSSACKSSATRAAWWKFRSSSRIFMKKTNRDWSLACLLWRQKISEKILYWFNKSPWCSGYHICLTRRRSAAQASVVTFFVMHCKGGRKKSISIWSVVLKSDEWLVLFQSYYNSRWCSSYHFSSACKSSATRAAWWKFRSRLPILIKKTNRDWSLACLLWRQKISEKILYWSNKSSWCSGYHNCLTRRRSAVQARVVTFLWCTERRTKKVDQYLNSCFEVWRRTSALPKQLQLVMV